MHAVMGRSTAGLRNVLQKNGIEFDAPLMSTGKKAGAGGGAGGTAAAEGGTRSMLVFEGWLRVFALFDFMLNRAFELSDEACDVPLLIAPVQFTNATVKKYSFAMAAVTAPATTTNGQKKGGAGKSKGTHASAAAVLPTSYQLELKGRDCVPGWVCDRLLRVLSVSQGDAGVTLSCEPLPASIALNWHTPQQPSENAGDAQGQETGTKKTGGASSDEKAADKNPSSVKELVRWFGSGCLSKSEGERWCQVLHALDSAAVKELTYAQGTYKIIQTTARVLPIL